MSGVPSGGDRLAAFQQNIDQADGPVIVIGAGFAQVILDIAEAARAQAEREPGALDTAIRSALARLDSDVRRLGVARAQARNGGGAK